jgi:RNA polymerase sigma factor (sigma-70 family)
MTTTPNVSSDAFPKAPFDYVPQIRLYQNWLKQHRGISFDRYEDLWQWSISDLDVFWQSIWDYFAMQSPTPHTAVLAKNAMPGAVWFPGAKVNYAQQVLRHVDAAHAAGFPALIAQNLDVKEKDVIEMEQRLLSSGAEMSIDAPAQGNPDEPNRGLLATLVDSRESADLSLEREELLALLGRELPAFTESLNEKERMVLQARILSEEPKTLQEVADEFGLTRERVRQIESKLIEKLKKRLEPHLR